MDRAKPFDIPKREVWEAYKGLELITERQASTASRLRTSRLIFPTTSTSSGIGFRRAVIIRRQCEGLIYLKEMGEEGRGHWVFPRSPTASLRRLSSDSLSLLWSPASTRTPMGTGPANRRSMRSAWRGSDAGAMRGFWISTSRASLIESIPIC